MLSNTSHIRKAAVLLRSLDADTAAKLLAQLSPAEAAAIRVAVRSLGQLDPEEQADVAAEFRRVAPVAVDDGVELTLSTPAASTPASNGSRRFEFLHQTPIEALVPCLAREHAQTIAVVLSYVRPERAAEVLAALPAGLQVETLERLSALGESDPDCVTVLERELATWLAGQRSRQSRRQLRTDTVAAILTASQQSARDGILANLKQHNQRLADDIARLLPEPPPVADQSAVGGHSEPDSGPNGHPVSASETPPTRDVFSIQNVPPLPPVQYVPPTPSLRFDDLARLGTDELAAVLQQVDANVLVLALAGSSDALVDEVTARMPRKVAKAFRRQLRHLGPTRLSDVEAAQTAVATIAAQTVHTRRRLSRIPA